MGRNRYLYVCIVWSDFFVKTLSVKINVGATLQYFGSNVFVLKDGTCLTSYKFEFNKNQTD
jgi:hypothetical protein